MNTDQVRIFLSVTETRNFTMTAHTFGYTQSAVSQSIKKLEETLNLPLLTRGKKTVTPTQAAVELLPYMRELVRTEDTLLQTANAILGYETGTVRIGSFASMSAHLLPHTIKMFSNRYPAIQIELIESTYWDIERMLQAGELDLGFISIPTTANLEYKVLPCESYKAVLPKGHRLAESDTIPLDVLLREPFIVPADNFKSEIGQYIAEHNLEINELFHVKDDYVTISMVRNGLGVSILPKLVLDDFSEFIETRDIEPGINRVLGIATKSFTNCTPAGKRFLDYLIQNVIIPD